MLKARKKKKSMNKQTKTDGRKKRAVKKKDNLVR